MKKEYKTLLSISSLLAATFGSLHTGHAQWEILDDFEDGDAEGWTVFNTSHGEDDVTGFFTVMDKPFGGEGMALSASAGFGLYNDFHIIRPIPPIEEGETGTLYFEVAQTDEGHNTVMGLTDVEEIITEDPENLVKWGNYEASVRIALNSEFDVRNEGEYQMVGTVSSETWYKVWMVVDNWDDVFDVYVEGGEEYPTQTLIAEDVVFRNTATFDPLVNFLILMAAGNPDRPTSGSPVYYDNLAIDLSGENLEEPETDSSPMWDEYPMDADGWVDTGSMMGWINVSQKPYVTSVAFGGEYVYLPESSIDSTGGWGFTWGSYSESDALEDGWLESGSLGWVWTGESPYVYALAIEDYLYLPDTAETDEGVWFWVYKL